LVPIPLRVAGRAASRYTLDPETGCWVSDYATDVHGYCPITWKEGGRKHHTKVHRAAWTHYHGEPDDDIDVDHRCFNRRCVRLDHLRLLSPRENRRRTNGDDWPVGTGCKKGHPDTEQVDRSDGGTRCRQCARERKQTPEYKAAASRRNRAWRETHDNSEYLRAWRQRNPDRVRQHAANQAVKRRGASNPQ
jgi:hypothetical protein